MGLLQCQQCFVDTRVTSRHRPWQRVAGKDLTDANHQGVTPNGRAWAETGGEIEQVPVEAAQEGFHVFSYALRCLLRSVFCERAFHDGFQHIIHGACLRRGGFDSCDNFSPLRALRCKGQW